MANVNWERLARATGIVFVVLAVIGFLVIGDQPKVGDSSGDIASFYTDHRSRILSAMVIFGFSVLFVFLIYFLHTTGELCLSPVGLSAMNRLAPKYMASLIMGAWFYMTAVGNFVAGKIGEATGGEGGEMTQDGTLAIYNKIGWITVGIGLVVLALSPVIRRWMHLDTLRDDRDLAGDRELAEPQAAGAKLSGEVKA